MRNRTARKAVLLQTGFPARRFAISDLHLHPSHPNPNAPEPQIEIEHEGRAFWTAVALLALLVGGIAMASMYSGADTQTAMNKPQAETTGSGTAIPKPPQ